MRSVHAVPFVLLMLIVCCPVRSFADDGGKESPNGIPPWREPSQVALEVGGGKSGDAAKWTIDLGEQGDFLLELAESSDSDAGAGRILVVGGQFMVVSGLELETGYEMDALDMPAFHFQLLYELLETLFPKGPGSLSATQEVEHSENSDAISVGTASATGEFAAPWFVKGTASRREDTSVDFDFRFTFTVDRETAITFTLRLLGAWNGSPKRFVLRDEFSIEGWTVFAIGPHDVETADGVELEYGAQVVNESYRTVGELRAGLEEADEGIEGE